MTKLIIKVIFILLLLVFIVIYEGIYLLYFEENLANRYASYGAIPLLAYVLIATFIDKYKFSIKDNKLIDAAWYSLSVLVGIGLFYYFFMVPIFSGGIIMTNDLFKTKEITLVKGRVVGVKNIQGAKLAEYELTIQTEQGSITFDTNGMEVKKYSIGDDFIMEMENGFWGLLTKRK